MTNFYIDGGNTETKLSIVGPYIPCTMKQLATIHMVEHSVPYEIGTIIQRNQRWLDETSPEVIVTAIGQELYEGLRRIEGKAYMTGRNYDEPQGVFCSNRIQRVQCALLRRVGQHHPVVLCSHVRLGASTRRECLAKAVPYYRTGSA